MRRCERCGERLDVLARSDARFCSTRCRVAHHRAELPAALRQGRRFVRADGKRPITTSGRPASTTRPSTWATLAEVRASSSGDGFGVMLGAGLGCYDLDHCTDEQVRAFARTIPERVVYAERSMSSSGAHVFIEAPSGRGWKRTIDGLSVERYTWARFIRMTGNRIAI